MERIPITINVIHEQEQYELKTYAGEYRNLMVLLNNKLYLEEFGECGGMGRCGTCLIEIIGSSFELPILDRNEDSTIRKMRIISPDVRLACQIMVNRSIDNISLKIYEP